VCTAALPHLARRVRHGCVPSCVLVRRRQASPGHARRARCRHDLDPALVSATVLDRPKSLPAPPADARYTVFITRKQWAKIAEALAADPEDAAIIEGYAALDPRVDGIAVYATGATTKRMQAAKRAATAP